MTQSSPAAHRSHASAKVGLTMVKIAALYMVAGLSLGLFMGVSKDFTFTSVHSHVLLLGWATMAVTGLAYVTMPRCASSGLARLHFWGHNIGLPIMTAGLVMLILGSEAGERLVAPGSTLVLLSLIAFAANVLRNGGRELSSN